MKLNVNQVLKEEAERAAMEKPLPKVRVIASASVAGAEGQIREVQIKVAALQVDRSLPAIHADDEPVRTQDLASPHDQPIVQTDLLQELNAERIRIKKERAILSSETWQIVEHITERLKRYHPNELEPFQKGDLPMPELAAHASKIEALTQQGAELFDRIRYVEQYGKLPEAPTPAIPSQGENEDAKAIKYEIRRLGDRICKTGKKIRTTPNAKPSQKAKWNENIAYDEARITELRHQLKKIAYEAGA